MRILGISRRVPARGAREAFDENLGLNDEATKQLLARVVENLLTWTQKLKN
jgi:hypothetical protein